MTRARTACAASFVAYAASLVACVAAHRPDPRSDTPSPPAAKADAGIELAAPSRAQRIEAERRRLGDPSNVYFTRDQAPPRGFQAIPEARAGRFPGVPFAAVRAYNIGFARPYLSSLKGAACDVVAPDGTMCPDVTAGGVLLTAAQAARLVKVAESPPMSKAIDEHHRTSRVRMRCGFDPHHAFVFFDAEGRPVAEVHVCFSCSEWLLRPRFDFAEPIGMWPEETDFFRALCAELHLGGCNIGRRSDQDDFDEWTKWYASPAGLLAMKKEVLAMEPDVPRDEALADATPLERRKLCAWYARAAVDAAPYERHPYPPLREHSFRCDDRKVSLRFDDLAGCLRNFPSCRATVAQSMQCLRERIAEPCGARSAACESPAACTFGVAESATPASAPPP